MAVEPYPTKVVDGESYWVIPCLVPKESDPERGTYIFFAKPLMGITGLAGLIKGDPGKHTVIDTEIARTVLEADDPTPDFAQFVEITPGSDTTSQVVQLQMSQRKGPKGDDGDATWDPTDLTPSPVAGTVPAVNSAGTGFDLVPQKASRSHWAGSLNNAPAGTTATFQLGTIAVSAGTYQSAWRPHINAGGTVTGSSSDIKVDIVARLGAVDGPIVGRGHGVAGVQTQRTIVVSGPPAGTSASDGDYFVAAGAGATIYLMAEKQSGAATYSTAELWFSIDVEYV
ncbi:hypothetical protein A5746_00780 [Mycolicibacterium conceptionense]|nr:hypothetical protein A5746_00780 [Mycolicibacterium conceptionense]